MIESPTVWAGALVTLAVLSYLVRDNAAYRFVQHATLGTAVGINTIILWRQVLYPRWYLPITTSLAGESDWTGALWLLALLPGGLWYFQLSRRWAGLSTLISGLFIGAAAGLAIKYQTLLVMPQVSASIRPLSPLAADGQLTVASLAAAVNNLVFLLTLCGALLYFFFSLRTGHAVVRGPLRFGRLAIMVCLGAMFGGTVMTRIAYLLDRLLFLYHDWLKAEVLPLVGLR